jgi:hypothetical protein
VPGDTPHAAVASYVRPLQVAISCVSNAVFGNRGGHFVSEKPHVLTLSNGPVRLRRASGALDLVLSVSQQYRIVPWEDRFRVHTLKYAYKIDNWTDGYEIMAYHWDPDGRAKYPHLHLSHGTPIGRNDLLGAHLPTGRIALEDVIQFLIEFFEVVPARADWAECLEHSREQFRKHRTWG